MTTWDIFHGPNAGYAREAYDRYREDPQSVDADTRELFQRLGAPPSDMAVSSNGHATTQSEAPISLDVRLIVAAARLARSIREYGHLAADIDPLGAPRPGDPMLDPATHGITDEDLRALPATVVFPNAGPRDGTCLDAIRRLRTIYCGPVGYEFDHVENYDERTWLHEQVESGTFRTPLDAETRRALLVRLTQVEAFERFLHTVFVGQKRFSLEGNDALVLMLDELIERAAGEGVREVIIGMAHRGRLNVLAHVLGKPYEKIFSEFHTAPNKDLVPSEGSSGINRGWTGDVKYHLGAHRTLHDGKPFDVQLTLADNPSHLEFVNPAVEGQTRAAQDDRGRPGAPGQNVDVAVPITIHGDAAFSGEGVVAETLNFSGLPGYTTGGTFRLIVNNQIGFTTRPEQGRSTVYASDLAKGFEIPIVHVNADDPEACLSVVRLAFAYRQRFHKDFLIDLVGYRRWGHNEGDEPSFTQPRLYESIGSHPTARKVYADTLIAAGIVEADDVERMQRESQAVLQEARERLNAGHALRDEDLDTQTLDVADVGTAVSTECLRELNAALLDRPTEFHANPRLDRVLTRRRDALDRDGGVDWGLAESLAFASILADGTPIRLTGQDAERGTFSQRHLVLHEPESDDVFVPLQHLPQAKASFAVYNSPLTEAAVLGFEYGYSVHAPDALVLWEAQFGDFANAGQVVIDQFIFAARAKWRQFPSLVMLLPHGYEGQGPEHSSGRLERYLQLAAEDNVRVADCTTPAQYFHLLRLQAAALATVRRPLIVMTPKSLLRHPRAVSSLSDLANGSFQPVLVGPVENENAIRRIVFCSGKVAVDLAAEAEGSDSTQWAVLARLELLYPFPERQVRETIERFPNLQEVVWTQEEPENMGAWSFVAPRLRAALPDGMCLGYVGRPERASPAEGSPSVHAAEQARIVQQAWARQPAGVGSGGK